MVLLRTITSGLLGRDKHNVWCICTESMQHEGCSSLSFGGNIVDDMFGNVVGDPSGFVCIDPMVYDGIDHNIF